jgi:hypothetical protein
MNDDALTYLQGDSQGRRRDLITRCYYEVAQGDPKSGPIVFAVLVNAAAEQFAKTPQDLLGVVTEFRKLLAEGREMEARIRERVELSNYGVVAEFKDETRRASDTLRESFRYAKDAGESAKETAKELRPVIVEIRKLAGDVTLLRQELKIHDESHRQMVECANKIETAEENIQHTVMRSSKESRANWISLGLLVGIFLSAMFSQLPWWGALLAFSGIIGLLQWLSRQSWDFVRRWIEKRKSSSAKSKPSE